MKPRLSSDPRTEPFCAAAVAAWKEAPKDNPAFKRLISWALGLGALWLLLCILVQAWPGLFPAPREVLKAETLRALNPQPAPRATLYEAPAPRATLYEEPAPRALPVYHIGDSFKVRLPDGREFFGTERGAVPSFSSLPLHPQLGDHYTVTEGGAEQGVSWVWYTPLGWNHPAWIDP